MRIIPAIDIIDGKCVRLKGITTPRLFIMKIMRLPKEFEAHGIEYLHWI
jgi:phosphoribosylformimino-5-aminoimidazole carboxamide ribotide isomerase